MKQIYLTFLILLLMAGFTKAQPVVWSEGFETSDSLNLPSGWSIYYNSPPTDTLDPFWNWTVRTVGSSLPGLQTSLAVVHSGTKSIGVSWYAGQTTTGISDAWLVTKKIRNVPADGLFSFWVTGGSTSYSDSVSIWISTGDSTPASFLSNPNNENQNILFPIGSTYGLYEQYFVDLSSYAGQNVYIGFRYNMNTAINGYFVQLDDVEFQGTVSVNQIGSIVPDKFSLNQNYPNPFNPVTKITFDLPKNSNVKLTVFNSLGQKVTELFNGFKSAGKYEAVFDGGNLTSGTYFYRLETEYFTETKKMQLIK
ncbi:MAG: T9SS type A sorting domain-containing protein [Ignavibacteria bacterium]|nr:T9SS type A sorting domain-containing protein [Ignavibacteria bacterium]